VDLPGIKARLNLYAVLQNLEELVRLDPQAAAMAKAWDTSVQFTVRHGPEAYLDFTDGVCRHGRGRRPAPAVSLLFTSPAHLNRMFDGTGMPIPLRGLTRLGWLKKEFSRLTDRLGYYLLPSENPPADEAYRRLRTMLLLQTAVVAAGELAECEPLCQRIAARIPDGVLAVEVLPDGPRMRVTASGGRLRVDKAAAEQATARMVFSDIDVASDVLEHRLDSFRAVAEGKIVIRGLLPIIDEFGLILDRVEQYLS